MDKKWIWMSIILSLALIFTGCSSADSASEGKDKKDTEDDKGTITIGYNNFAETIAEVNVWKLILEDKGYDVDLQQTEKGPLFASLAKGDVDVNVEVWLPDTDKPYVDKYKDDIVEHEAWYEDTTTGVVVPEYVDIDSIEELNEHKDDFDGEIIGIEPGASIMNQTEDVVDDYNLDYNLIESSDSAMSAELKDRYENKEPIAVTLREPHWAFSRWDLKFLDDPKKSYGDPDKMHWFSREGFADDFPEVTQWFDQWDMSHDELSELMDVLETEGDEEEGAKKWIEDNQDLVEEWTKS